MPIPKSIGGFVFCLLLLGFDVVAQTPFHKVVNHADGLPSNTIYSILASESGQMFFGTASGLCAYDGLRFTRFPNPYGKTRSVTNVYQDQNGTIWCHNFSNQLFYLEEGKLKPHPVLDSLVTEGHQMLSYQLIGDFIYVLTQRGLFVIKKDALDCNQIYNDSIQPGFGYIEYNPDSKEIILSYLETILIMDLDGKLLNNYKLINRSLRPKFIDGKVFLNGKGEKKSLGILGNGRISVSEDIPSNTNWNCWVNILGEAWLTTNWGIQIYDSKSRKLRKGIFPGKRISDATTDHEGNIWIGTLDEGLILIPSREILFMESRAAEGVVRNYSALSRYRDNEFFVGTADGFIYHYKNEGTLLKVFNTGANNRIDFIKYNEPLSQLFFSFGQTDINLQTYKGVYFGKDISFDSKGHLLLSMPAATILYPNSKGELLVSEYISANFPLVKFSSDSIPVYLFDNSRGRSALVHNDSYFIGTENGLFRIDENGKNAIKFQNKHVVPLDMTLDYSGNIWVATINHGLLTIADDTLYQAFPDYGTRACQKIAADDMNGLWVVSDNQLLYFNTETGYLKNISGNLPLMGLEINDLIVGANRELILATNRGVVLIPFQLAFESLPPQVYINEIQSQLGIIKTPEVFKMPAKGNALTFELLTFHYRSFGNYEIEYKLSGIHNEWQRISPQNNLVQFISLPSGKYTFEARSVLNDRYSDIVFSNFEILPPFWTHWWFLLLLLGFSGLIILGMYTLVIAEIKRKESLKEKLATSQITAIQAQMSPHFIFNILNSVQGLIYANEKTKASDLLGRFSELIRNTLDYSGKKEISLKREIEHLRTYISLEQERFEEDFVFEIVADDTIPMDKIQIPSMILQPFVENAIKHGLLHKWGIKKLNIHFRQLMNGVLQVEIDDNGVGRKYASFLEKRAGKHQSFATKAINQRIELMNQIAVRKVTIKTIDKKDNVGNPLGTRILIDIPYESSNH
jgi:ligand-binding sensor domain-containing protein